MYQNTEFMTRPTQFMDIFLAFIIILRPFSKVTHLFFMPSCNPCHRTPYNTYIG